MARVMNEELLEKAKVTAEFEDEELVAILDAGSQYGKVIDRRVRELSVATELLPLETPISQLKRYKAIIISGGPGSVYSEDAPRCDPELFSLDIPILGICYGMQLLNLAYGGEVTRTGRREDGQMEIRLETWNQQTTTATTSEETSEESRVGGKLWEGVSHKLQVLLTHGDTVTAAAPALRVTAKSRGGLIAALEHPQRPHFGVQFHPEVELTPEGPKILRNFLFGVAKLRGSYTLGDRQRQAEEALRAAVGHDQRVMLLCSGGVDSTVCAALLAAALEPQRIVALHIDNGFMRRGESAAVVTALRRLGVNLTAVDAAQRFYNATLTPTTPTPTLTPTSTTPLCRTIRPEDKRHIIGDTFMRVAQEEMQRLGLDPATMFVAQGTLRPDLIESASALASTRAEAIKTHHNDTQLVRELRSQGKVLEPLRDYHKDEVRALGTALGLPPELIWRQPFPGPGLAIRIICTEKPFMDEHFQPTQHIVDSLLKSHKEPQEIEKSVWEEISESAEALEGFEEQLSSLAGHVLPVQSVGVQGDARSYRYVVALSGPANWKLLFALARMIPQICHHVNRVVYLFGEKLQEAPTEITPTHLTPDVIEQLQEADHIVNKALFANDLTRVLSQVPIISVPLPFGKENHRSIVLRPFVTNDFMTGVPAVPGREFTEEFLFKVVKEVESVGGISRVMYDLTSKPPGTTEWE